VVWTDMIKVPEHLVSTFLINFDFNIEFDYHFDSLSCIICEILLEVKVV
jgi:hypothetical protein